MVELMQKIIYYENLITIKNRTNSELYLTELNNWQLCRTCLKETTEDDLDLRNMCVMEVQEGRMLNGLQVLRSLAKLEEPAQEDELPVKVCIECLDKIQSFYYFTIQVRKAENVLKLLAQKLKMDKSNKNSTPLKSDKSPATIEIIEIKDENDDSEETIDSQNLPNSCQNNAEENVNDSEHLEEVVYTISFKDDPEFPINDTHINEDLVIDEEIAMNNEIVEVKDVETNFVKVTLPNQLNNCNSNFSKVQPITQNPTTTKTDSSDKLPKILDTKCAVCQEIFNTGQNLINHANKFHPKTKAFECRNCTAVFSKISTLYQHNRLNHIQILLKRKLKPGFNVSKYFDNKCTVCDEVFKKNVYKCDRPRKRENNGGKRLYLHGLC